VTVNAERYIHMLNTFLRPQMKRQRLHNMQNVYFQQDGATPQTARLSMDVVRRMFPGRVISRFGDIPWPPRSPELTTCKFFSGNSSNHMSILTNLAPCPIWRRQSGWKWQQLIVRCWNAYTLIFSEGLKTAFKKVDTTCLTLSFIHNMQFKWHVSTKIFL